MKSGFVLKGALSAVMLAGASWALAQSGSNALDTHIDFTVKDADLIQALDVLTKNTGIRFVIKSGKEEFGKVNLRLEDTAAADVLQYVCQAAGARAVRDDNGVYIVYGPGAEVEEKSAKAAPSPSRTFLKTIRIMNANPEHIMSLLAGDGGDYEERIPGMPTNQAPFYNTVVSGSAPATALSGPVPSAGNYQRFGGIGGGQVGGGQGAGIGQGGVGQG
ncbi:MAG: hypothetical protein ABUL72_00455, partial [Armatimonadota bacterium]